MKKIKESVTLKLILLVLTCSMHATVSAQTVIIEKEPAQESQSKFGPNRQHFVHFFFSLGFYAGKNQSRTQINYFNSTQFNFGLRYKLKLTGTFDVLADLTFDQFNYQLRQNGNKTIPDTVLHKKENLLFNNLGGGMLIRANLSKRGNSIRAYIDGGYYYQLLLSGIHQTKNNNQFGGFTRVSETGLPYINPGFGNLLIRFGYGRLSLYYQYRLTNIFTPASGYAELTPSVIGFQIGLF
jgi:hypothetical protein